MAVPQYNPPDLYNLDDLFTEEQKLIRSAVRKFIDEKVQPHIDQWAQDNHCPLHLIPELGELGVFGPSLPVEYGCPGLDQVSYGIIMQEVERCDSGLRSMVSVQGSLV